ncbi:MAG: type II secretion system GspH family protein [Oculatellaceae cyanobacterium Prado106]|jgi:prepilin-type N-terminal cleavage/methylation domain-containing protein|nr:type II secretion system GspH family protein [Oculatellaceae cyanobacterium Prado106]
MLNHHRLFVRAWLLGRVRASATPLGFTLIEVLVVVAIIGILFAISAPAWNGFLTTRNLNAAQDEILQAMRQTQSRAKQSKRIWQLSLREFNGKVQFATHPATTTPQNWQDLATPNAKLDIAETTLLSSNGIYRVQFTTTGGVTGQLGRVTLKTNQTSTKRCIIVSTLLGTIREGESRSKPDSGGRYCY